MKKLGIVLHLFMVNLAFGQIDVSDVKYCGPGEVKVTTTGTGCADYKWYGFGSRLVGTGCEFTSPLIALEQEFYVENTKRTSNKTIGYGFNLERAGSQEALDAAGIKKSLTDLKGGNANLTEEEASRLMQGEMGHFKGVAERYVGTATWKKLSPNRQGILTNMAYNMGEGTFLFYKQKLETQY